MKCSAAVAHGVGQDWAIEEIEVDPPKSGEVLVQLAGKGGTIVVTGIAPILRT